jgi:hypothetical protein
MEWIMKQDYCNIPVVYHRRSNRDAYEMRQWLVDHIDPECYDAEDWAPVDGDHLRRRIWFSHQADAMLFSLRWM